MAFEPIQNIYENIYTLKKYTKYKGTKCILTCTYYNSRVEIWLPLNNSKKLVRMSFKNVY